jgi:multidrug efflux pump subunit AcrA (membrane-fusion protein)
MAAGLALAGLLGGCNREAVSQQAPPPPPEVSVAPAFQREVQEFEEFTARLEAPDTVEIRARVAGALEQVHFTEGQRVAKGDLLFTIDPRPFAAEVARAEAPSPPRAIRPSSAPASLPVPKSSPPSRA